MNKQKAIPSILNFIREITIVIIGIFVAFQLNNYNENRKTNNNEVKSLKRLLSDLETEKNWFETYKKNYDSKTKKLEAIIYTKKINHLDSLYYYLSDEYIHYNFNTEYSSLKFSGKLDLISNDSLRYNLVKYYEINYAYYKEVSENHKNFVENDLLKYFENNNIKIDSTYLYNPELIREKLKEDKFEQKIKTQIMYYKLNSQTLNNSIIEGLIEQIKQTL